MIMARSRDFVLSSGFQASTWYIPLISIAKNEKSPLFKAGGWYWTFHWEKANKLQSQYTAFISYCLGVPMGLGSAVAFQATPIAMLVMIRFSKSRAIATIVHVLRLL